MLSPMAPKEIIAELTKIGYATPLAIFEPISDVSGSCLKCAEDSSLLSRSCSF
jgi:hypothetical protein